MEVANTTNKQWLTSGFNNLPFLSTIMIIWLRVLKVFIIFLMVLIIIFSSSFPCFYVNVYQNPPPPFFQVLIVVFHTRWSKSIIKT